jgi:hypothetical protein
MIRTTVIGNTIEDAALERFQVFEFDADGCVNSKRLAIPPKLVVLYQIRSLLCLFCLLEDRL